MTERNADKAEDLDLDKIKQQFETLRTEMKAMTEMMASNATRAADAVKDDAIAQAELLGEEAKIRAAALQNDVERAVVANPLTAIAVCAGIGFLIGALTRR